MTATKTDNGKRSLQKYLQVSNVASADWMVQIERLHCSNKKPETLQNAPHHPCPRSLLVCLSRSHFPLIFINERIREMKASHIRVKEQKHRSGHNINYIRKRHPNNNRVALIVNLQLIPAEELSKSNITAQNLLPPRHFNFFDSEEYTHKHSIRLRVI